MLSRNKWVFCNEFIRLFKTEVSVESRLHHQPDTELITYGLTVLDYHRRPLKPRKIVSIQLNSGAKPSLDKIHTLLLSVVSTSRNLMLWKFCHKIMMTMWLIRENFGSALAKIFQLTLPETTWCYNLSVLCWWRLINAASLCLKLWRRDRQIACHWKQKPCFIDWRCKIWVNT